MTTRLAVHLLSPALAILILDPTSLRAEVGGAGQHLTNSRPAPKITPGIDPAAATLAQEVTTKLSSAQTLRLTAKHKLDARLGVGARLENGPLVITIKRPNQFYAVQQAGGETREIAYDGRTLCLIHPGPKHHALEPLKAASISQFANRMDDRFGFRPPVAELLASDFDTQIFLNVTSAKVTGVEWVGWTRCERLQYEQQGITGDIWIGKKDLLPRRYLLTFTDLPGKPTWDVRLTKWELNVPVDESLFSRRPAADSQRLQMLKSR
ncbi:DUF2092 domain-containing protein [Verrucomicrobium spinosum]|uniref:DUF2092 domain-containing protein n=1 Tax=Verrucomicrobium spinosum TaxID=2736 RepID=UPI00017443C4|nr:DUF2092 domain-containing protein [Verrucomicrobium spinosum]